MAILSLPHVVSFPDDEQKPLTSEKLTYCAGCVREHVHSMLCGKLGPKLGSLPPALPRRSSFPPWNTWGD